MKNKVRALRMQQSLAQGQLAEAMGVSRQTINSIENERYTPSLPLALALARFFDVTVEEMFDDQGSSAGGLPSPSGFCRRFRSSSAWSYWR